MKKLSILLVTIILLNACNAIKIQHQKDESADFTKYKTFSFFGWSDRSGDDINEFDKKRIEQAFGAEFRKRGLEYVKNNGDLTVSLFIQIDKEFNTVAYANHYSYGGYGFYGYNYNTSVGWGIGVPFYSIDTRDYHQGTLVIDVFDAKNKKLVWQAIGTKKISEDAKTREKNTPKMAANMLRTFPVKNANK